MYFSRLFESGLLTPDEDDVLRWARNSNTISPPRNMDALQYRKATALEVLVCGCEKIGVCGPGGAAPTIRLPGGYGLDVMR